jgi:diguanylate cyclase (GGDEF)-like protein
VYDGEPADLAAVVDITERKATEETLRRLATTDALTGVANRGHFMQRAAAELDRARRYGRPLSVVMLDIDHFKQINDRHGHAGGDEVLRAVTTACKGLVRQQDTIGRLGGEEFGLLMPETEIEPATMLAERLRAAVAALKVRLTSGDTVSLSASFGVGTLKADDSVDTLLARADGALYASKHGGRNRVSVGTV